MSDEADTGSGENEVDSHSSSHQETSSNNPANHRADELLDQDNEAALNTNYDSSDGAVPVFRYYYNNFFFFC